MRKDKGKNGKGYPGLFMIKLEKHPHLVNVTRVQTNGMRRLCLHVREREILILLTWRTSKLAGSVETEDEEIADEAIVLHDKGRELETANEAVGVGVRHIFVTDDDVVLCRDVVGDVVIDDESKETIEERHVHLLGHTFEFRLEENDAFAVRGLPDL